MDQLWGQIILAAIAAVVGVVGGGGAVWKYLEARAAAKAAERVTENVAAATQRKDDREFINDQYRKLLADDQRTIDSLLSKVDEWEKSYGKLKDQYTEEVIKNIRLQAQVSAACQTATPKGDGT